MIKVCYLTQDYVVNIGNAFIDIGAKYSIETALKNRNYNLTQVSGFSLIPASIRSCGTKSAFRPANRFVLKLLDTKDIKGRLVDRYVSKIEPNDMFNLSETISVDYFVFSGCIFTIPYLKIFRNIMSRLKSRKVKTIFYGCGGNSYTDNEIEFTKRFLKELEPYAIVTRDSIAFENYGDLAEHSFNGIDCAYYVNKLPYGEIDLGLPPYVVLTFDKFENTKVESKLENDIKDYEIIKATHVPFPEMDPIGIPRRNGRYLISDSPHDYLNLYSHANEIHSDRVHACVLGISFGVPSQLYSSTLRSSLFEKTCHGNITKELCRANSIIDLQQDQINFLEQVFQY